MKRPDTTYLKEAAVRGIKWTSVSQLGQQALQFATSIILARLLSPPDFGLASMAFVVIAFVSLFKELGTSSAVIQQQRPSESLLASIFWINTLFGLMATIALFTAAPLVSSFFAEPRVTPILMALAPLFFLSGLSSLQKALLERNLAFRSLAKVETSAMLIGSIASILSAVLGAGVWSLAFKAIAETILATILYLALARYRPQLLFDWPALGAVKRYSLSLVGFNISNYFTRNADYILIGRFLGAEQLGYYTLAYRLMLYPLQNISSVIGRVTFPFLSQIQDQNERFRRAYLNVVSVIALVSFPMMLGLLGLSDSVILTLFGAKWMPVIPLIKILALVGMLQSVIASTGAIYQCKGRTDWMLAWGLGAGLVTVSAFALGLKWGTIGVAIAYAITYFVLAYPCLAIPFRLIDLRVSNFSAALLKPFVCALAMLAVVVGVRAMLPTYWSPASLLLFLIPLGCAIYLLSSLAINRSVIKQVLEAAGIRAALFSPRMKASDAPDKSRKADHVSLRGSKRIPQ